jgi:CRP-like cAMP-binding protein
MFHLLAGSVGIRKGDREIARIGPGGFFGEMTFLLGQERSADAVALGPCRCVVVRRRTFDLLLREFPDTVHAMLVEMASRLRDTSAGQASSRVNSLVSP